MATDSKKKTPGAAAEPTANAANTVPGIRVAAKVAGFCRAGRAWSAEAVDVPVSDFAKEQLAQLRGEPKLVVVDIEVAAE
jgi:hypothetical protein